MKTFISFLVKHRVQLFVFALFGVSAIQFWRFMNFYSVNLLYMDQWLLYELFTKHPSMWDLFTYQTGIVRLGVGYLITWVVGAMSHWDVRVETSVVVGIQIGVCMLFLLLKRKLFGKWQISDICIPITILSYKSFEWFAIIPLPSYGALTLLFLVLLCFVWTLATPYKYLAFVSIGFIAINTGYSIIAAPVLFILLFSELRVLTTYPDKIKYLVASITVLLVGLCLYFYRFDYIRMVGCDVNPIINGRLYPLFIGTMVMNYILFYNDFPIYIQYMGFVGFIFIFGLLIQKIIILFSKNNVRNPLNAIQVLLLFMTIVFLLMCTIGRSCLGISGAYPSRYLLYFIPTIIALYFHILQVNNISRKKLLLVLFIGCLFFSEYLSRPGIQNSVIRMKNLKNLWKECYLSGNSVKECNDRTSLEIISPESNGVVEDLLLYTKQHRLHIFYRE